jgi:alpha-tubulin suppressor-like RCC1 family protein
MILKSSNVKELILSTANKVYSMDSKKIVKLTAGKNHFCALLEDSTEKYFGKNSSGQLGNGSTTSTFDWAVAVLLDANTPLSGITVLI